MKITKLFFFLSSILLMACESDNAPKEQWYQAEDYVFVGDFTTALEGPCVDKEGNVFFVNPERNGTIGKVSNKGQFELFIDSLPNGSFANGIRMNTNGHLFLADYVNHNVLLLNPDNKSTQIYAHEPKMNQPNDLAIMSNGTLFASDPNWGDNTGNIWMIKPNKEVILLDSTMGTTNGIEVSPDETKLYVNESVQRNVWIFDITEDGISNKRQWIQFDDFGMDGMRCDEKDNLYIARYGKGVVAKVSPKGELLEEIKLKGEKPTNIAFGGEDGKTIFVTLQDRGFIEQFRVPDAGRSFVMKMKKYE